MNSLTTRGFAACAIVAFIPGLASAQAGTTPVLAGDANQDYTVNISDLLMVLEVIHQDCPGEAEPCPADFDGNDQINIDDLLVVIANWGATAEPPASDDVVSDNVEVVVVDTVLVDPEPVLLDAVYYDMYSRTQSRANLGWDLDQGWQTRGWNSQNGVDVLPYAYGGGVDYDHDMEYTDEDLDNFQAWLDENIPFDYEGPVVLDMEGEWWHLMNNATQREMDDIIDFYIQGLEYAESMRPNVKFGYWGLPKKHMTLDSYTGASVDRLLKRSGAIFPDTYESNVGGNDYNRMKAHIEACIEKVEGDVPVYVQMSPRYQDQELGGWRHFHTNEELMRDQVNPTLDARWTDDDGHTHRVSGIALWDAYVYVKHYATDWYSLSDDEIAMLWDGVDAIHLSMYQDLLATVAEQEPAEELYSPNGQGSPDVDQEVESSPSIVSSPEAGPSMSTALKPSKKKFSTKSSTKRKKTKATK